MVSQRGFELNIRLVLDDVLLQKARGQIKGLYYSKTKGLLENKEPRYYLVEAGGRLNSPARRRSKKG
jgi:hypothetical protein